jgi:hypothetical protein
MTVTFPTGELTAMVDAPERVNEDWGGIIDDFLFAG